MSATVVSLSPSDEPQTVDFLRRLAGVMNGGRNAEMLLSAAGLIETLTRRATLSEQLYREQQENHARNIELREAAELTADHLVAEIAALKAQLAERDRQAEIDRAAYAEEKRRSQALAQDTEARLAKVNAVLEAAESPALLAPPVTSSIAAPVEQLRIARAQFDYLADGFARTGDLVSRTICEIGGCAIDKAIAASQANDVE
jgi:glycine/D-amino acid oxidase-like deaminating enzyme